MSNKKHLDVRGGDSVRLKDGSIVVVADIRNNMIMVSFVEWYYIEDVVEIVERFK